MKKNQNKFYAIIALFICVGCTKTEQPASPITDPSTGPVGKFTTVKLSADDAKTVMDALGFAGLTISTIGSSNATTSKLSCILPMVVNTEASCSVVNASGSKVYTSSYASQLLQPILDKLGARKASTGANSENKYYEVTDVSCSKPVIANPVNFCSVKVEDVGISKTLKPDASKILMDAMATAGILDMDHLLGATNLKADRVTCTNTSGSNLKCSFTTGTNTFYVVSDSASAVNSLLESSGARTSSLVGTAFEAVSIFCTRPVIINPQSTCTLKILPY